VLGRSLRNAPDPLPGACLNANRGRRRDREPEPGEEGKCLSGNGDVALETLDLAGELIETSREGSFEPIDPIRGEERGDCRFDNVRLAEFLSFANVSTWPNRLGSRYTFGGS
jgi:hypothetical protein